MNVTFLTKFNNSLSSYNNKDGKRNFTYMTIRSETTFSKSLRFSFVNVNEKLGWSMHMDKYN
jgi:hypothetical protein